MRIVHAAVEHGLHVSIHIYIEEDNLVISGRVFIYVLDETG
jgi:hypothetical protein